MSSTNTHLPVSSNKEPHPPYVDLAATVKEAEKVLDARAAEKRRRTIEEKNPHLDLPKRDDFGTD